MVKIIEGSTDAREMSLAVVVSRFNESVSARLLEGALKALGRAGAADDRSEVHWVPGAWELPLAARRLAASGRYDAIIALGCVVRGGTPHFEYVSAAAAEGLARVMLDHDIPLALGVLTCDTLEQAMDRAGGKLGNKGAEAALSAIEIANLLRTAGKAD
ncbi:MAG: 6,7-dimethyl-8-ribityllumazine synthase [Deltaproteobacteria bacterium]|nr:6,7-dimethyl-8-ribityllumazine synthase [Deltaproteobacteria bacterium]